MSKKQPAYAPEYRRQMAELDGHRLSPIQAMTVRVAIWTTRNGAATGAEARELVSRVWE